MKSKRATRLAVRTVLGIAALVAISTAPQMAEARVGGLDPAFGDRGRVTTSLPFSAPSDFAVGPEGSVVFDHGGLIERLLPNGETDLGFGDDGAIRLPEKIEGLELLPGAPVLDSKGRIVVFAIATDPAVKFLEPKFLLSARSSWLVVLRLSPNGELDKSFGEGKGFIRSDFGIGSGFETDIPLVGMAGGRVDSQNRPVILVSSAALTGRCNYGHTGIANYPRAVVRLTEDGRMDASFGAGNGISPVYGAEWFSNLELDGASQPVVAVPTENCKKGGNRIFRFGGDGQPLAGFGAGGLYYPGLYFSAIEPGGQLILQRGELSAEAVARADSAGNLDPTFGENGIAPVKMPKGANRRLKPVGADAQGRIILVGSLSRPAVRKHSKGKAALHHKKRPPSRDYVVVTRLTPSGKTDLSFGNRGWITTGFTRPQHLQVDQATLDPEGRLVIEVGSNDARQKPETHLVLARYLLDG